MMRMNLRGFTEGFFFRHRDFVQLEVRRVTRQREVRTWREKKKEKKKKEEGGEILARSFLLPSGIIPSNHL